MSTRKISNISIKDLRTFLKSEGLTSQKHTRGRGGHEKWAKEGLDRPITFSSHIDPVPNFVIKNILRILQIDTNTFYEKMNKKKSKG